MLKPSTEKYLRFASLAFFILVLISCYAICTTFSWSASLPPTPISSFLEKKLIQIRKSDVKALYQEFNFQMLWIKENTPTPQALELRQMMEQADLEGLNPADYQKATHAFDDLIHTAPEQLIERDIQFSEGVLTFIDHLRNGRFAPDSLKKAKGTLAGQSKASPIEIVITLLRHDSQGEMIKDLALKSPLYRNLRAALAQHIALAKNYPILPTLHTCQLLKIGSKSPRIVNLHKILRIYGDLITPPSADDSIFTDSTAVAVKNFQSRHLLKPTGIVDAATCTTLNKTIEFRINRIIINMERLRWYPDPLGNKYIFVNIAGYEVMAFEGPKLAFSIPIVVGHPTRQTALFDARLVNIILNPSWGVPISIMMKDKVPKIIENINYLYEKGYTVTDTHGVSVNPMDIDWENDAINYRLRQRPGRHNALGNLRFTLEDYHHKGKGANDHGIYMHGTPEMELFKEIHRDFSSGCIRLQEPQKLAEWLLTSHPEWNTKKLSTEIAKNKTQVVKLNEEVFVYIGYFTAWATPEGIAFFGDDPYSRDAALTKKMRLSNSKPLHKEPPPWFIQ